MKYAQDGASNRISCSNELMNIWFSSSDFIEISLYLLFEVYVYVSAVVDPWWHSMLIARSAHLCNEFQFTACWWGVIIIFATFAECGVILMHRLKWTERYPWDAVQKENMQMHIVTKYGMHYGNLSSYTIFYGRHKVVVSSSVLPLISFSCCYICHEKRTM